MNNNKDGYYIGIMSGTSLDGMDTVIVKFSDNSQQQPLQLVASHSKDFNKKLKSVLLALCQPNGVDQLNDQNMSELDWFGWASREYAQFASEVVSELLAQSDVTNKDIIAIGCHGQTVRHRPQYAFTLQLIDPNLLAEATGISVVSDFRRRDMAVGGQGAPLVPAFHQALFAHTNNNRIIVNLGGIANITVLNSDIDKVIGYDTGPANLLIDDWALQHIGKAYDDNGDFARSGKVIDELLKQMLQHPFFAQSAPKSTGREGFHLDWVEEQLDQFDHHYLYREYSTADVQATLTELTARTICDQVIKYYQDGELFVCGGGAYNGYLLDRLQDLLGDKWIVMTSEKLGLAPTWVEAVAFAWLARQTMLGEVANVPAVTGADKAVVLGQICFA